MGRHHPPLNVDELLWISLLLKLSRSGNRYYMAHVRESKKLENKIRNVIFHVCLGARSRRRYQRFKFRCRLVLRFFNYESLKSRGSDSKVIWLLPHSHTLPQWHVMNQQESMKYILGYCVRQGRFYSNPTHIAFLGFL